MSKKAKIGIWSVKISCLYTVTTYKDALQYSTCDFVIKSECIPITFKFTVVFSLDWESPHAGPPHGGEHHLAEPQLREPQDQDCRTRNTRGHVPRTRGSQVHNCVPKIVESFYVAF